MPLMIADWWHPSHNFAVIMVAAACLISAFLVITLRSLLRRYALTRPNIRSSHKKPTPQGGGIALIAATILVAIAGATVIGLDSPLRAQFSSVLAAAAFIAVIGAIDDMKTVPIIPRLLAQSVAAIIVIAALPDDLRILPLMSWWPERLLLLVALLWFVNLVNFMDGIDWMTVVEVVPITGGLVLLGAIADLPAQVPLVALALLGATIGFSPFNKPVATLFLGDAGSLPIGLLLGWLLVLVAGHGHLAAALLLPLYYLVDATITLLKRLVRGARIWDAHREHFYQRALDRGLSIETILARVFATNIALVALAALSVWASLPLASVAALGAGGVLVACVLASFAGARQ